MSVSTEPAPQVFLLPDLGEGLAEAEVVDWKVTVGDTVTIDQVVVEVETAKAVVEVPSPFAGVVQVLHGEAGATVIVGAPLITIAATAGAALPTESVAPPSHEQHRQEERAGSGNVLIGYGTSEASTRRRRRVRSDSRPKHSPVVAVSASRVLSPVVRKLARDNGVELSTLAGSGAGGVIRRCDVETAMRAATNGSAQPNAVQPNEVRIPLTGLRRVVADKLSTSRREIPDATTWVDVDATELMNARRTINAATPDEPISLLALLARLCIAALAQFPELNSSVDTTSQEIVRYRQVNLGIAAQTPRGLVVPVIDAASTLSTAELSAALRETTALAKDGKLTPGHLSGGTFTLNNYGVFGVDGSTPIINHPEAAILGIGRIVDKPWVIDGQVVARKVTQLSLTFDHRVCDGGVAGGFLRLFADYVENPVAALRS
ncbi:MAG: 2-oxo acid dehydrogenase subunit E2, partial [Actinomycetota bacterium]|nr:2-oxo acid dehydrogenase subunit E2 [Actinomycetota bacterium]